MAFGGTADSFPSRGELGSFLDHCGGICDAQSDQESTIYALSIDREELENGIKILIETAFRPVIDNETINEGLNNVENEIKYLQYEKIRDKVSLKNSEFFFRSFIFSDHYFLVIFKFAFVKHSTKGFCYRRCLN